MKTHLEKIIITATILILILFTIITFKFLLVKPRGSVYKDLPDTGISGWIKKLAPEKYKGE